MREIVLDTETTGFDAQGGDRIVEIGCIELLNHIPSGREWHAWLDPERDMPQPAFEVHGLSDEFLKGKPLFADVAQDFLDFIARDKLIIHNAGFDIGFLNAEFSRIDGKPIDMDKPFTLPDGSTVIDLAVVIHRQLSEKLKSAKIWGTDVYDGQNVQLNHVLNDKDIIELHFS